VTQHQTPLGVDAFQQIVKVVYIHGYIYIYTYVYMVLKKKRV
jgi:hypothetical protein